MHICLHRHTQGQEDGRAGALPLQEQVVSHGFKPHPPGSPDGIRQRIEEAVIEPVAAIAKSLSIDN